MRHGICSYFFLALIAVLPGSIAAQDTLEQIKFTVERFEVLGDNPIGDEAVKVLVPYVGEHFGLEGLSAAADALEQAVIDAGFSFHRVSLPPQQLFSGSVQLKISRFAIGKIEIEGNLYFDDENIFHSLPELVPGQTPNTKKLSRSLKLANSHASKNIAMRLRQGETTDTIDADIKVEDRNQHLWFVSLDNTGTVQTEEFRSTLGYQHGNLFNRDHAMTATLSTAPEDPDVTSQYGLNYRIPFYSQGASLDMLLSDSEVNSGTVGSSIDIAGKGSIVGVIYNKTLLADSNYNHYWSLGLQHKLFENEITVAMIPIETKVLSLPLGLGYSFTRQGQQSGLSGGVNLDFNISGGKHAEAADYTAARAGADEAWSATRYFLGYDQLIGEGWLFRLALSGQITDDLLISGEQFGVGGASSLRGFEERSVTGDSGYQASLELHWPEISSNQLRFLAFYDLASLEFNDGGTTDLSSAGLGMRWAWQQSLNVTLDYGYIIEGGGPDININRDGDSKLHFSLDYRF